MGSVRRWGIVAAALLPCSVVVAQESPPLRVAFNIERQPIREALKEFADQAGLQIFLREEDVLTEELTAPSVVGELSAREALEQLLAKSDLKYEFINNRTVRISRSESEPKPLAVDPMMQPSAKNFEGNQMINKKIKRSFFAGLAALFTSIIASPSTAGQETQSRSTQSTLEEVIVTAQKREQSLQNVPISLQVYSGEMLTEKGLNDLSELSRITPNLQINDGFTGQSLYIRGIGTIEGNKGFESAVATFNDGIYTGRSSVALLQLVDIERVEILRGPQPTFFGQNAIAGALNITTRKPGKTWEGYANAAYGSDDEVDIEAAFGGPINDVFGIRGAVKYFSQDGWMDITATDDTGPSDEDYGGRVVLSYTPSDNFDVSIKGEWAETNQEGGVANEALNCNMGPPATVCATANALGLTDNALNDEYSVGGFVSAGVLRTAANPTGTVISLIGTPFPTVDNSALLSDPDNPWGPTNRDVDFQSYTLASNWRFDNGYVLAGTAGYYDYDQVNFADIDATPIAVVNAELFEEYDQTSLEIRLTSPGAELIDWMIGGYWQQSDTGGGTHIFTAFVGPLEVFGNHYDEDSEWLSFFAQATWNVTDSFRINLSGRYTEVEKEGFIVGVDGAGPGAAGSGAGFLCGGGPCGPGGVVDAGSRQPIIEIPLPGDTGLCGAPFLPCSTRADFSDDDVSPQVGVELDVNKDMMAYYKYSEAFKSGGFNGSTTAVGLSDFVYGSESVESHEVGLKSELLNGALRLNVAVFVQDFSGLQVVGLDPSTGSFKVRNAAAASTDGIEAELLWSASDMLTLGFNGALLDAEFDEFDGAQCNTFEAAANPACLVTGISRAGFETPFAPDWATTFTVDYRMPLGNGRELQFASDAYLSSDYACSDRYLPGTHQDSYEIINLRLGVESADRRWTVAGYARNVTDEKICLRGGPGPMSGNFSSSQTLSRGERFGVQVGYRFGN